MLLHVFFDRLTSEAGGRAARRVLLEAAVAKECRADDIAARTRIAKPRVEAALATFAARGVLQKRAGANGHQPRPR